MFEWYLLFGTAVTLAAAKLFTSLSRKRNRLTTEHKSVFITGCDSGIGNQCAKRLNQIGFKVFAGCLFPEGEGAKALRESSSGNITVVPLDITKDESVLQAVETVKSNLPEGQKGLYGLINNAGILMYGEYDWFTMQQVELQINVNLLGTLRVIKHFTDLIVETPGRIVNITSINGKFAYPGLTAYCSTKFGLEGFSDALRYELKKYNVKVVIIEPGDFSGVTNILDQHKANLNRMLNNMTGKRKERCQAQVQKMIQKIDTSSKYQKLNSEEAQKLYDILQGDMEDALLAENPELRYVSAPTGFRIAFFIMTKLPGELMDKCIEKLIKRQARK